MYHMVAIPQIDQHVHHFLWWNLETECKPDTYVKTVLTCEYRPSPTMAIVALNKTAELMKNSMLQTRSKIIPTWMISVIQKET